jgi:hypothetical protein
MSDHAPHDYSKALGDVTRAGHELLQVLNRRFIEPGAIRAIAQAKIEALRIEELGKIEIEIEKRELLSRGLERKTIEVYAEQANLEAIGNQAVPLLKDSAEPTKIDPDWMAAFSRHATAVSDAEMRSIWSKVLAGEANQAGSFSKRTMAVVSDLSKQEAELFAKLARFKTNFGPVVGNVSANIYISNGVDYGSLMRLQGAGLIHLMGVGHYTRIGFPKFCSTDYFGNQLIIPLHGRPLNVGSANLTTAGEELIPICSAEPVEGFLDYLLKFWYEMGAMQILRQEGTQLHRRMIDENGKQILSTIDQSVFQA